MKRKSEIVSAFDAKTHLSSLLRETEAGRSYTISRRGKPVARLVPFKEVGRPAKIADLVAAFRRIRSKVRGRVRIRELIEGGRRF